MIIPKALLDPIETPLQDLTLELKSHLEQQRRRSGWSRGFHCLRCV